VTILALSAAAGSASSQAMPGVLGFSVVAALGVVLFFLLRSMNKQLRKVAPPPKGGGAASAGAAEAGQGGQPTARPGSGPSSKP
jgi:hypothetical protein